MSDRGPGLSLPCGALSRPGSFSWGGRSRCRGHRRACGAKVPCDPAAVAEPARLCVVKPPAPPIRVDVVVRDGGLLLLPEERFLAVDVVDLLLLDVAVVEPGLGLRLGLGLGLGLALGLGLGLGLGLPGRSRGGRRLEDGQGSVVVQLREVPLAQLVEADGYVRV